MHVFKKKQSAKGELGEPHGLNLGFGSCVDMDWLPISFGSIEI
jgi:hypothetical protein